MYAYNQRAEADAKLADLLTRAKGVHFLRLFKDEIPAPPAGIRVEGNQRLARRGEFDAVDLSGKTQRLKPNRLA